MKINGISSSYNFFSKHFDISSDPKKFVLVEVPKDNSAVVVHIDGKLIQIKSN